MVLGIARPRQRFEGPRLFSLRQPQTTRIDASDWADRRGTLAFEAAADVLGGFPGFADCCCSLSGAQVRITSNYLLVGEGTQSGFAIPIDWISGTYQHSDSARDEAALRIFYRDQGSPRTFTLLFRPNRLVTRGMKRAARAQHALRSIGVDDRFLDSAPLQPNFTLPWEQTSEIESENVIWNGRANAPISVGGSQAPSDVWLTTKSIIWGSGAGEGINRIPLTFLQDMVSTRLRDRLGTPVIYLAIGNDHTGRFELPFLFDLEQSPDRNFRERGAFLVGLRSRGLPDGSPAPLYQPWRFGFSEQPDSPEEPEEEDSQQSEAESEHELTTLAIEIAAIEEAFPASAPAVVDQIDGDSRPQEIAAADEQQDPTERFFPIPGLVQRPSEQATAEVDIVLAEWSGDDTTADEAFEDFQIAVAWHDRDEDYSFASERETVSTAPIEPVVDTSSAPKSLLNVIQLQSSPGTTDRWESIKHYEEVAIGALTDALRVISNRVSEEVRTPLTEEMPSSWEQATALANLAELYTQGVITPKLAASRRERILTLGDVCVRLRTLVELHDGDYLSAQELDSRRAKLMTRLSDSLVPSK